MLGFFCTCLAVPPLFVSSRNGFINSLFRGDTNQGTGNLQSDIWQVMTLKVSSSLQRLASGCALLFAFVGWQSNKDANLAIFLFLNSLECLILE